MEEGSVVSIFSQSKLEDPLTEFLRDKARELLHAAVQAECSEFLEKHSNVVAANGHSGIVRNGYLPKREVLTGLGPVPVSVPRVRDRTDSGIKFNSRLVPAYVRRAASVDVALPWLYLRGISQNDVGDALSALLGKGVANLSSSVVSRLKAAWAAEYETWKRSDLSKDNWVYIWADGIYSGIRAEGQRMCVLVVVGVNERGQKQFLAIEDGVRESSQSWREVLIGLKNRGLSAPKLAVGDGAMGFWAALEEVFPSTTAQRCWVHKMVNVLNYLPKSAQPKAKSALQQIWMAETRVKARNAFANFMDLYDAKYPKATECLSKDETHLMAFYDYPAEHWIHLRTSNVIESAFATIRHRTDRAKGAFTRLSLIHMMFKLAKSAEGRFKRIRGFNWLAPVIRGVTFVDGVCAEQEVQQRQAVA